MGNKRMTGLAAALTAVLLVADGALAQEVQTIQPGMTVEEVTAVFGQPDGQSSSGPFTYYFYNNGCERECGFPDLVIFQDRQVVDAVLRAPWHEYAGESSSPKGTIPRPTPGGTRLQVPSNVEGVEVRPATEPAAVPPAERADTARADTTRVRR